MYLLLGRPIRKGSARQIANGFKNSPVESGVLNGRNLYCPEKFDQKLTLPATFQLMKWALQAAVKDE